MKMNKFFPVVIFVLCVFIFFKAFFLQGNLPIPSDTIIGLYHPFRDLYAKEYPRGIPFKNFLITDPVRQQYPWRNLAISIEKKLQLPLWNPYNFAGVPLLANFQAAAFYPLNILFFILPFSFAWSLLVIAQPLPGGMFMYAYLVNLRLSKWAGFLGAIVFSFSGFSIAWLEWNTIGHTALWLPLILLSIDKILFHFNLITSEVAEWTPPRWQVWSFIFLFSLISSFFAGHLQTFFYLYLISLVYFITRWVLLGKQKNILLLFIIFNSLFIILTSVQWIPTLQFISESARSVDQINNWQKEGWFIPLQHLIQFIAPDFFGNTSTLNYWGAWNYGEFIGYIGIFPLIIALFAIFIRRDRKTLFYGVIFFLSLIFSFPTIFAKIPYIFEIPFLSTTQPTRLLFVTDFSLAVLAALGFDYFFREKKGILYPLGFIGLTFVGLWGFVFFGENFIKTTSVENLAVAKRNLIFPTSIFVLISFLLLFLVRFSKRSKQATIMIYIIIVGITVFDLLRFANKFTPFTKKEYLFPQTKVLSFLQKQQGQFRIMTTDDRILPPNFSTFYRLQSIDGYDPLYLRRYGELIAASERGKADISPPFGFNRIITPHRYDSKIIDLLGVKYVLSLSDIESPKLKKVFQEGETRIYENNIVLPRAFFIETVEKITGENKKKVIEIMYQSDIDLKKKAIVEGFQESDIEIMKLLDPPLKVGKAAVSFYSENKVTIKAENTGYGFLVFTDSYYPTWHASIDGKETEIYRTDSNFRGIFVPKGNHVIEFYVTLL